MLKKCSSLIQLAVEIDEKIGLKKVDCYKNKMYFTYLPYRNVKNISRPYI